MRDRQEEFHEWVSSWQQGYGKVSILPVKVRFSASDELFISINIGAAVIRFISDIVGLARVHGCNIRRARTIAGIAALTIAACTLIGCGGNTPKLAKLPADAAVLAFGDSLTFGTGAQPEASYPAVLERLIGRKVWSAGVPGEVSAAGLARLPSALDDYQPALLVLCHGGNDFLRQLGDAQAAENLRAMIRIARQKGVAVVLIAVPKPGLLPSPPDFYAAIAKEFGLPLEDAALKAILRDNELKSDLAHPNARGYAKLAETIAALMKKSGAV